MLLSDKASADPIPVLEILTNDVARCGHGATAGAVDARGPLLRSAVPRKAPRTRPALRPQQRRRPAPLRFHERIPLSRFSGGWNAPVRPGETADPALRGRKRGRALRDAHAILRAVGREEALGRRRPSRAWAGQRRDTSACRRQGRYTLHGRRLACPRPWSRRRSPSSPTPSRDRAGASRAGRNGSSPPPA